MKVLDHETIRKVNEYIDTRHSEFLQLGRRLFEVFGGGKMAQVRNLQQVACSALRFADIEDFVKNQMGKTGNKEWKRIGKEVLNQLEQLRGASATLAGDAPSQMAVRLKLARAWVRAVISEYLYQAALKEMEGGR